MTFCKDSCDGAEDTLENGTKVCLERCGGEKPYEKDDGGKRVCVASCAFLGEDGKCADACNQLQVMPYEAQVKIDPVSGDFSALQGLSLVRCVASCPAYMQEYVAAGTRWCVRQVTCSGETPFMLRGQSCKERCPAYAVDGVCVRNCAQVGYGYVDGYTCTATCRSGFYAWRGDMRVCQESC